MSIQSLPDLFCAVGGFVPFLEQVCEGGEVKIIDKHALILLYETAGNQSMGLSVICHCEEPFFGGEAIPYYQETASAKNKNASQ